MTELGYDMDRTIEEIRPTYRFRDTCEESVPEAVMAYLEGQTFEEVVRLVVSLGGDADTQGAMACSIAAVTPGMEIPDDIFEKCYALLDDNLKNIFLKFDAFLSSR